MQYEPQNDRWGGGQFVEGTPIYDATGSKVATVSEHSAQGGYLLAHKGLFFPKDVYIPMSAIERADADGVYLNLTQDQLQAEHWSDPPTATAPMAGDLGSPDIDRNWSAQQPPTAYDSGTPARQGYTAQTQQDYTPQADTTIPVREEELIAGKRTHETGRVQIQKGVEETEQTVSAPVTHEEVRVERVPVNRDASDLGPDTFQEQNIDVPLHGEELVAGKRARIAEEVRLHKDQVTEEQQLTDTVRREHVNIEGVDDPGNQPHTRR